MVLLCITHGKATAFEYCNLINQIYFKFKSKYISYGINVCRVFREGTVVKDAGWWGDEKQGVILPTEMRTCEHTLSR